MDTKVAAVVAAAVASCFCALISGGGTRSVAQCCSNGCPAPMLYQLGTSCVAGHWLCTPQAISGRTTHEPSGVHHLAIVFGYLGLIVAIGWWSSRRTRSTMEDYPWPGASSGASCYSPRFSARTSRQSRLLAFPGWRTIGAGSRGRIRDSLGMADAAALPCRRTSRLAAGAAAQLHDNRRDHRRPVGLAVSHHDHQRHHHYLYDSLFDDGADWRGCYPRGGHRRVRPVLGGCADRGAGGGD